MASCSPRPRRGSRSARRDGAFAHAAYLEALAVLRNELEAALSDTQASRDTSAPVERIQALKAAHTIEAAPERSAPRQAATIAEPVTTRILNRAGTLPSSQTEPETVEEQPLTVADPSETPAETGSAQPAHTSELLLFPTALPAARKPNVFHTKGLTRDKRQMSLF
jgi:hypothetical protein